MNSASDTPGGQALSPAYLKRIFLVLLALWSVIIAAVAFWHFMQSRAATLAHARAAAHESISKDIVYRRWATMHGGVYAPVTELTPPNPHLADVPERDITTPSGRKLTLVNPAYMTRQAHEIGNQESGSKGHITSLNPIRPENAPDAWESRALKEFENGAGEAQIIETIGGIPYFRFMRPLTVEAPCMTCHEKQGYKVGDIRGGISASVPWDPYLDSLRSQIMANLFGYAGLWVIGVLALRASRNRLAEALGERTRAEAAMRDGEARLQRAVAELEHSNAELQTLNAQLVQSQNQLLQSEKMASIGQLAAGVAHEINNPIGFVTSNLRTLGHYADDLLRVADAGIVHPAAQAVAKEVDLPFLRSDLANLLAESHDGLARVSRIVANLKDFSHVDEAEWQEADLLAGLESTVNVVWHELKYKAEIVRELTALPRVRCIPAQINQVFMNLLVNSAQAIAEHGTITLRSGQQGDEVWLEIADTGAGMSEETQRRMFEPFYTTKPVGKGTGLGMSLSYDIIMKHGGRFEVSSAPGAGTRIRIWLPLAGPPETGAVAA